MVTLIVDREVENPASVAAVLYAWAQGAAISWRGCAAYRRPGSTPPLRRRRRAEGLAGRRRLHLPPHLAAHDPPGGEGRAGHHPPRRDGAHRAEALQRHTGRAGPADHPPGPEESFQDHFNSYRETFPEFLQRLREDPGHRWDHWWLAFVDDEDGEDGETEETEDGTAHRAHPAGALVSSVLPPDADGVRGSYVDYIGVNRRARGRAWPRRCCRPSSRTPPSAAATGSTSKSTRTHPRVPTSSTPPWAGEPTRDRVVVRDLSIPARA